MEISLFTMLYIAALLMLFSISLSILIDKKSKSKLPPGKTGFPIIGETFKYLSKARNGEPEKFVIERMAKYSSQAFKTSLFGEPMIAFCGASGNKFLFSNENKLVNVWFPKSLNKIFPHDKTSSIEEMIKMKKFLPQFLRAEALHRYIGIMDSIAQKHLNSDWGNKNHVTVSPLSKQYTFLIACRLFLSIEDPKHITKLFKPFESLASGMFSVPIDLPGTAFNHAIKSANLIRKEIQAMIKQRKLDLAENRASPTQDILSHMLLKPDEDGKFMEEMDMANKILGLLVGGHETTSAAIACFMKYLAELPEVYNKVLKEQMEIARSKAPGELLHWNDIQKMKYSWNVACEVMRLVPPVHGAFREAIEDFSYAGFIIPKGWKLYWSPHSSHRNPNCFPEPEEFDPSRFEGIGPAPYTYVPFGGGPRMCPGKEYARVEILVFVHNLVRRYRWEMILPNEKIISDPLSIPEHGLPIRLFRTS